MEHEYKVLGECTYRIEPNYRIGRDFSMAYAVIYMFFDISDLMYSWNILATYMMRVFFISIKI